VNILFFEEKITKTHILYALYTFVRYNLKQIHHHQDHTAASLAHTLMDACTGSIHLRLLSVPNFSYLVLYCLQTES